MPNGNSTYHALQTKIEKRFSSGFSVLAAYTWSKTMSDADVLAGGGPAGQTFYNRRLEKAVATTDVPHSFALSYVYELPFGPGKPFLNGGGFTGKVVGGWTLTGIHQYSTGVPVVLSANNTLPLFNGTLRPDVISGGVANSRQRSFRSGSRSLDQSCRVRNPVGTARRNRRTFLYRPARPGYLNESFGLIKRTPLTERIMLTFRAEFFNAFNRVVFGGPKAVSAMLTSAESPAGEYTTAGAARSSPRVLNECI